jgi:class 3 adenylate cyclase
MPSQTSDRKLAAILSADVAGYSRLMAEDEAGTIRTLTAYREAIGSLVQQHRGRARLQLARGSGDWGPGSKTH